MSGQVELTNPVDTSVGGMKGHILRRVIHVSMAGIPLLYFGLGEDVASKVSMDLDQVVASVVLFALVAESIRLAVWNHHFWTARLRSETGICFGVGGFWDWNGVAAGPTMRPMPTH